MSNFPIIQANKYSIGQRKPIHGCCINDADYVVQPLVDGKRVCCPYYRAWKNMLERVFDEKFHIKNPTYKNTAICEEWLTFSNFKKWMEYQDWKGKQLDKDVLIAGNKIYSPENCVFVSHEVNSLLSDAGAIRGDLPQGVHYHKAIKKYGAKVTFDGDGVWLGGYDTPEKAESAYKTAKAVVIARAAVKQADQRIINALMTRAHSLNVGASQ